MKKQSLLVAVLVISLVTFSNTSNAATLTYSFDDGHISVYSKAYPILENYGQVGTANVISNTVWYANQGWTQDGMNSSQLLGMQNAGWEICSHSKTHPHFSKIPQTYNDEFLNGWTPVSGASYTYQTNYSYQELPFVLEEEIILKRKSSVEEVEATPGSYYFDASSNQVYIHKTDNSNPSFNEMRSDSVQRELDMSKSELTEMGLDIQNFIVPFSDWSQDRRSLAMEYYNSVGAGYHDGLVNDIPPDDPYWLARFYIRGTETTIDDVKDLIAETIDEDGWLILMFHCIGESPEGHGWPDGYWSEENFESLVAWVNTQDIQVLTQQQGLTAVPIPPSFILFLSGLAIIFMRPVPSRKTLCENILYNRIIKGSVEFRK
jgi:hypothetical protein